MIQVFGQQSTAHLQSKLHALEEELGRIHPKMCVSVAWARMMKINRKPGIYAQHNVFAAPQNATCRASCMHFRRSSAAPAPRLAQL